MDIGISIKITDEMIEIGADYLKGFDNSLDYLAAEHMAKEMFELMMEAGGHHVHEELNNFGGN